MPLPKTTDKTPSLEIKEGGTSTGLITPIMSVGNRFLKNLIKANSSRA